MENKRAQGMSTSTIILLILGLVILVVLILGFTLGWNKIAPWINSNNLETIKTSCIAACSTGSTYDFCSVSRDIRDGVNDKFGATCQQLATDATLKARNYGIEECPDLCPVA
ncbi:MAG: hypothetical protein AABY32_00570 [Nanoarchaeota archaeon]